MGIKSFVVTSEQEILDNPKYVYQYQKQLTKAQRSVSRKKKGSSNRKKAIAKLARIHLKIPNTRKNFQHKLSTQLIRENQTIVVENLQVSNLLKNHQLAKAIRAASARIVAGISSHKCWNTRLNGMAALCLRLLHAILVRTVLYAPTLTAS